MYASLNNNLFNSHRNHTNRIFYQNMFRSIDLCVLRDASIELFCVLRDYETGTQDAEVTNSMQVGESAVRRSLQFFSLSEKCRMTNVCRCQDKGGTFSSVILSH